MTSYAVGPCFAEPGQLSRAAKVSNCIEPLKDSRWDRFLAKHPSASVFHSSPWLAALNRTYGFQPIAYTTSAAGEELENAMVFCRVESWLTGRRLVSLPFSDHCEPLVDSAEDQDVLTTALMRKVDRERWSYLELRPLEPFEVATTLPADNRDLCFPSARALARPRYDLREFSQELHATKNSPRRARRPRVSGRVNPGAAG